MPGDDSPTHVRVTLSQRAALGLLRGYQLLFSPLFAGSCRFVPSCSAYAAEAVARYGVARGSWMAVKRLSRCRPLAAHGFDPVPLLPVPHDSPAGTSRRGHVLSHD